MPHRKYEGSINATAIVTIQLQQLGSWGTDYTMDQIIDQAREAAIGVVSRAFKGDPQVKMVEQPKITAVYAPAKPIGSS
jgi:hypothetical protein